MTNAVPFLMQGKNIILVIDGKSHTVSKNTHMNYGKIVDALKNKEWDDLRDLIEPKKAIVNFGKGHVSIDGTEIFWKGKPFHNALAKRMIEMYQEGFPIDPMIRFMENLMANPSKRSVDQVYGFLEKNNLPITEDGHFLAYKKVKYKTYMDIHSGTIYNGIGSVVEMDRNGVDDNPDSHCSSGLHFCSISYLSSFGTGSDPIMILKINPADVVSIPTDYDGAKGRCCKYEVVAEVQGDPAQAFASVINSDYTPKPAPVAPKAKAQPAPKAQPEVVATAVWPFPPTAPKAKAQPAKKVSTPVANTYDVLRVNGLDIVAQNLSYTDAQDLVAKNVRQKKAKLAVVYAGTTTKA